jgi:hypothetical protein
VIGRIDHPIRTTRDCVAEVQHLGAAVAPGILAASGDVFHHGYYFYLRNLGPWIATDHFSEAQTIEHLTSPGHQTPVLIARPDYDALVAKLPILPPGATGGDEDPVTRGLRTTLTSGGLRYDQNIAILLPGAFHGCAARILQDGGWPLWDRPAPGR